MTKYGPLLFSILYGLMLQAEDKKVLQDINEIVKETQHVISIEAGQQIDTAYFKTLFLPTVHFTVVGQENETFSHETMDLNTFVETLSDEYYSLGYHEEATGQRMEEYNGIAQVMQSFKGFDCDNEVGIGVGGYQLIYSEGRRWIANMVWTMSLGNGKDIPSKYLTNHE